MIKFFRKLKWLINNQEKIEEMLTKPKEVKKDKRYSLQGIPNFQMEYVKEVLAEKD